MSVIVGISVYTNTMSAAIYHKNTQEIEGKIIILATFGIAFKTLSEDIKEPISRTIIAFNDHFDPEYQKKILDAVREYEFGKVTFIYHQTASAYLAWENHFNQLPDGQMFGVINKHFSNFHLTLYQKINSVYKVVFVHQNPSFDQHFANPALIYQCQNFFVNINDSYWIQHAQQMFHAQNVYGSNYSRSDGDGTARGAMINGKYLERSNSTMIKDCIPYSIQTVYNHKVQNTIEAYTDSPFNENICLYLVNEGSKIFVKQQLPNERKLMLEKNSPDGLIFGVLNISKNENGIENINLYKICETYTQLSIALFSGALTAYVIRR